MIVCSCNVIREQQIRDAARAGMASVEDIYAEFDGELNCCQCLPFARQIIEQEHCVPA